jgi:ElaB/YqjD/DUF883 family membrane-anchored ribosome-binding protein
MSNQNLSEQNPSKEGGNSHGTHETLKHRAENALHHAEDMLGKAGDEIQKHSLELRDAAANYVRQHPFTSIGTAALAGAIIALLLRR